MKEKGKNGARFGVFILTLTIVFALSAPLTAADESIGSLRDVNIFLCDVDEPTIRLDKGGTPLFSIIYDELLFDHDDGFYSIKFAEIDWNTQYSMIDDKMFTHININMDSRMESEDIYQGHLYLNIKVFSTSSSSEVTFSFTLDDMHDLPEGTVSINQQFEVHGEIIQGGTVYGNIEYLQFDLLEGHTGYYSWNSHARMDGMESKARDFFNPDMNSLIISIDYDPLADSVSIDSVELDKTMTGSAIVKLPEQVSHLPSIVIGLLIGSVLMGGVMIEKRREFYNKNDNLSVVRLEDSPYYKGRP